MQQIVPKPLGPLKLLKPGTVVLQTLAKPALVPLRTANQSLDPLPNANVPAPEAITTKGGLKRRPMGSVTMTEHVIGGELGAIIAAVQASTPGVIRTASSPAFFVGRLASGILAVDMALAGGFLEGRGHMLYGHKSAGKSTLSLIYAKRMQAMYPDKIVAYLDVEGTFDLAWAVKLGVDPTRLVILEPESGEHAVDLADAVVRAKETSLLIVDSIAMLTPMKEINDSAEQSLPGIHARLMGNMLRRATNALLQERHRGHSPTIIYLNQFRMSIGVTFGDPRVIPGGMSLGFAVSQQMEISNKETYANKKERFETKTKKGLGAQEKVEQLSADDAPKLQSVVANEHTFKITKDKTGGRIKEGMFRIIRDESTGKPVGWVDQANTIIQVGLMSGVFSGTKQSFEIPGHGKFNNSVGLSSYFMEHPYKQDEIVATLVGYYREKWGVT